MKRKENYPLQKVTLNLRKGDYGWLIDMNGRTGAAKAVREIIKAHVDRSRAAAEAKQSSGQFDLPLDVIVGDIHE